MNEIKTKVAEWQRAPKHLDLQRFWHLLKTNHTIMNEHGYKIMPFLLTNTQFKDKKYFFCFSKCTQAMIYDQKSALKFVSYQIYVIKYSFSDSNPGLFFLL